ncbi:hypothetical protein AURDEDRAFT_175740 [Auricularia subglabra TFB-10046 SS5]|uniref:Uncharacterized protein n=1 Tax=Auricularia subglabra (strain TFB-10046 / SS5) TaxID=717982 RepID=J0CX23_AURST|nr:hypothetical protein AURDEDRAFT_175740 [Auricularia subglabra TFB-10046 SS5]
MPLTDPLPRPVTTGSATLQKKRKAAKRGSRPSSSRLPDYYPAALTASNLAMANVLHARDGRQAPATTATDDAVTCSDPPDQSPAPHTSSARPRLVIRIPSLAVRRAQLAAQPPPSGAPPAPLKRARSPTPDSDEDEFAASFMRKRRVAAAWL